MYWKSSLTREDGSPSSGRNRRVKLFSHFIKGVDNLTFEERLPNFDLFTFEKRRLRGDMITIYNYIRGQYKELSNELFIPRAVQRTLGHPLRLEERRFHQQ
ncbi:hypothetical protein FKM82_025063 [Ascaphus truei]